jgi:flap endonuclease-1
MYMLMYFSEERVRKAVQRMVKERGKSAQGRLDSFFTITPKPKDPAVLKRKAEEEKKKKEAEKKAKKAKK